MTSTLNSRSKARSPQRWLSSVSLDLMRFVWLAIYSLFFLAACYIGYYGMMPGVVGVWAPSSPRWLPFAIPAFLQRLYSHYLVRPPERRSIPLAFAFSRRCHIHPQKTLSGPLCVYPYCHRLLSWQWLSPTRFRRLWPQCYGCGHYRFRSPF
mgnify:CR=1 FL=1